MQLSIVVAKGRRIALVSSDEVLISDADDALDLMASVAYEEDCDRLCINKEAFCEPFFDLSTGIAGEVLQKFANYAKKLAIVGDFSCYESKALQDLIYESNKGRDAFFVPSEEEAIKRLSAV